MSRRLSASIRANNKGRSLRPKTSQPRSSAPSSPSSEVERISSEPNENEALAEAAKPEAVEAPVAPASAAPVSAAPALAAPVSAALISAAPASAAPATEPAPKSAAPLPAAPPAVIASAAPVKAAAEPAPEASKGVTPPEVSAPAEPFKAEAKPSEPEPKLSAPASTKPDVPVAAERAVASESAAEAEQAPPSTGQGEETASRRKEARGAPASKRFSDEELDSSSISAEFFRRDEDSLPLVIDSHSEAEEVVHLALPLSPAAVARRARLRRVVAGVVAFAGVISLAIVGKTLAASKQPAAPVKPPVVVQQEAKLEPKLEPKLEIQPPPAAPRAAEERKAGNEVAKVELDPKGGEKVEAKPEAKPEEPKAEEPKKIEPSADAETLKKETLNLLNRGKNKDAIGKAREAIAADPADATSYLYLGSALQDTGKWKEGVDAYCDCVRNATKGPVNECRQMGGHK